jgi:hypothetical protein
MTCISRTAIEWVHLAEKAKMPVDQYMRALAVSDEDCANREASRRATPEEKARITKYLEDHVNDVSADTPIADILEDAGVPKKQGTSHRATKELKRVLQIADNNKAIRAAA